MSRKYKEELNKIVMSEEMKKRILHNVLNENIETKSTMEGVKKYSLPKRNIQIIAACFTVVVCLSVVKSNPQLLKHENNNLQHEEIAKGIDDENKIIPSDEESKNDIKNDANNNNTTNANDDRTTQESQSINQYSSEGESSKVKKSASNNKNIDKYNNETTNKNNAGNSPEAEKQETNPVNSPVNSNEIPSATSKLPSNKDNETKDPISSDKILKDTVKDKDETAKKKVGDGNEADNPQMTIASDIIKEYKTLEEAESSAGFKISPIKVVPKGFNIDNISVESNQIIQIEYNSGQDVINFRAGREVDNISGDYNNYESENTVLVNGVSVSLKSNKTNEVNLATWKKDNISYSISDVNGGNKDMILNMIASSL